MLRVVKALVSNGLFSVMSLLLSVLIARTGGSEDLGMFSVAYAAYLLIQLVVRDAGANTLSASLPSARRIRKTARRVSFMGITFAVPVLLVGLLFNYPFMVVLGLTVHGMCLYDYSKTLSLSLGNGKMALFQDSVLFIIFGGASALAFMDKLNPVGLMGVWAVSGAVLGYSVSFIQVFKIAPSWAGDADELRTSVGFGLQSLIGSGSVHIMTFLLAGIGGPLLVGSMRGASTVIGPANLITSSIQPLLITYFARTAPQAGSVSIKAVAKSSAGLMLVHMVVLSGLLFIGYNFGEVVLGVAWKDCAPLMPIVALDSAFVALGCAPLAAHRTLWAARRLATINTLTVLIRIPLVLLGAIFWGAPGAVAAFLAVTVVNTSAWWLSLFQMLKVGRSC